jgi:hypothetical protein
MFQHPRLVRARERVGDLPRHDERFAQREAFPRDALGDREAVDPLHHEVEPAVARNPVGDVTHDRAVRQPGQNLGFPASTGDRLRMCGGEQLECHRRAGELVERAEHHSHPPRTYFLDESKPAIDERTGLQHDDVIRSLTR